MRKWLGLVILASACASRESPVRPSDAAVDTDEGDSSIDVIDDAGKIPPGAADAFAANHRVFCKSFKACFPVQFANLYSDEDTCVARRLKLSLSVFFGPGSLLTTADIEACGKAAGDAYTCDDILRQFYENPVIAADCRLRGTHVNGTPCAGSDQCKSGYCRYEDKAQCGACADRVGPGSPCTTNSHCAEGLACGGGKCTPYVERSGTCDASHPCRIADVCKAGVCTERVGLGASCDDVSQDCVISAICSSATHTCVSVQGGPIGSPCGFLSGGGLGLCDPGLKCKITNLSAYTGNCVAAAKQGESCFRTGPSGSQCEAPLFCATTCTLPSTDVCR